MDKDIDSRSYWAEVADMAEEIIKEAQEAEHEPGSEPFREFLHERAFEWVDGHQWIIYTGYHQDIIKYTDNEEAHEDIGLDTSKGYEHMTLQVAFWAFLRDVEERLYRDAEELEEAQAEEAEETEEATAQ